MKSSSGRSWSVADPYKPSVYPNPDEQSYLRTVLETQWELKYLRSQVASHRTKLSETESTLSQVQKERKEREEIFKNEKTQLLMQAQVDKEKIKELQKENCRREFRTRVLESALKSSLADHSQLLQQLRALVATDVNDKSTMTSSALSENSSEAARKIKDRADGVSYRLTKAAESMPYRLTKTADGMSHRLTKARQ